MGFHPSPRNLYSPYAIALCRTELRSQRQPVRRGSIKRARMPHTSDFPYRRVRVALTDLDGFTWHPRIAIGDKPVFALLTGPVDSSQNTLSKAFAYS